jgi:serine/threonine protein kinase
MTVRIGQTLKKRYQIAESLGRGGMADVYKAWDENRSTYLALKLLRDDLSQDLIFMRRFRREARNLAQLQHPNIVRFYGLEEEDLQAFILMDYIEGPTLREVIRRAGSKGLPLERIQAILEDICAALHYAHKKGLVHCDIKSGNVLLDRSGKAYLTDFGISRGMEAATSTMVGIGTPAYMAPELIKGKDPTPQTDIYALGIVLYEMLTGGERPFTGERAEITGSTAEKVRWEHLKMEPMPVSQFNPKVSAKVEGVINRCLQKKSVKRFASAMDVYNTLTSATKIISTSVGSDQRISTSSPSQSKVLEDVDEKIQQEIINSVQNKFTKEPSISTNSIAKEKEVPKKKRFSNLEKKEPGVDRDRIGLDNYPINDTFENNSKNRNKFDLKTRAEQNNTAKQKNKLLRPIAIITVIVFGAIIENSIRSLIFHQNIENVLSIQSQKENCSLIFASDIHGDDEIYSIDIKGNNMVPLTNNHAEDVRANWSPDGTQIVYASNYFGDYEIFILDSTMQIPKALTSRKGSDSRPVWSSDGTRILYEASGGLNIIDTEGDFRGRYLGSHDSSDITPAWSPDDSQIVFASDRDGDYEIFIIRSDWRDIRQVTFNNKDDRNPDWSPDGKYIIFSSKIEKYHDIFIVDNDGQNLTQLTSDAKDNDSPAWSPDGSLIAFSSTRNGSRQIFIMNSDGSDVTQITHNNGVNIRPTWSPYCSNK